MAGPVLVLVILVIFSPLALAQGSDLRVSDNNRFFVRTDGTPFVWFGDTAWELFHRLNRSEAIEYLDNRQAKKFTVVQAVGLAELDGLNTANAHGDRPLVNNDPNQPWTTPGNNPSNATEYDYWDHVDYIVDQANARGIYIGFLPTWGRWVHENNIFTTTSAENYGRFLGQRYGSKKVIWILGGDRNPDSTQQARWRAMAKGIAIGVSGTEDYSKVVMTYHPGGGWTSSTWFHNDAWLDFNMWQTGHCLNQNVWDKMTSDYNKTPTKPVIDGEPMYEDHPICFNRATYGTSNNHHVRRLIYWDVFAGAFGHTYGHHSIWQMHKPAYGGGINGPINYWYEAINRPGGGEVQHARMLMESRPFLVRVPDQGLITNALTGDDHIHGTRGADYAFIYSPQGRGFTVNMGRISGTSVKCWWYNPRDGTSTLIGTFSNSGTRGFTPPSAGFGNDWVLVLDDAAKNYATPGTVSLIAPPNQVAAPTFSPAPGTFAGSVSVTISTTTSGASIRYTTDGTNPTSTTGTLYSGPVSITATTTLKAIAYKSGMDDSFVSSGIYTITMPDANITETASAPTIDGNVDSAWGSTTSYSLGNTLSGSMTASDLSANWRGLWDVTNLYVLAEVTDDAKRNDSTNAWDDDSVELYLDGNNDKAASYDSNDRQYVFGWNDTAAIEAGGRNVTGVSFSKADPSSTSYRVEARVPWSAVGVTVSQGKLIGFDLHVNDDDDGTTRDGKKAWHATVDNSWSNPSLFANAMLAPHGDPPPPEPPAAPTNLTATPGDGQVSLAWSASSGATSYNVKRSTTNGGPYTTIASPTTTSYTNTGLTNGTTYYYVVSAVNSVGESGNSNQVSATPTGGQVAAPTFSPVPGTYSSSQSVTMSTSTSGASIRFTTDGSNPTSTTGTLYSGPISIAATTTLKAIAYKSGMVDSSITSGTYTISTGPGTDATIAGGTITVDGTIDSTWSNANSYSLGTTLSGTMTSSDLSASWRALWDASNLYLLAEVTDDSKRNDSTNPWDDDSVELYVDGNNDKATSYDSNDAQYIFGWNDTAVVGGSSTSGSKLTGVSFSKVDPTATSYRIEARVPWSSLGVTASSGKLIGIDLHVNDDDDGAGRDGKKSWFATADNSWSNPSTFATADLGAGTPQPPAAPTGLAATAGNAQVALSWNASSGATTYNVKRSTTSGSGYATVASPTSTSHTDTSLTNGTTYYYVVTAVNSVGESGNSNEVSATPQEAPASLFANHGFESDLTSWSNTGNSSITTDSFSGAKAVITGTGQGGVQQEIAYTSGLPIHINVKAKISGTISSWCGIGIDFLRSDNTEISEVTFQVTATSYTTWSQTNVSVPTGTAKLRFWTWKPGTSGHLYVDDVVVSD